MADTHLRSILKAITWRIIASFTTFALTYIVTGEISKAASVGIFDVIVKIFLNYLHERVWDKVKFGRKDYPIEYEI